MTADPLFNWLTRAIAALGLAAIGFAVAIDLAAAADPPEEPSRIAEFKLWCWPYDKLADALEGEGLQRYGGGAIVARGASGMDVELWLGPEGAFASVLRYADGDACVTRGAKFKRLGPRLKGKGA